MKAIVKLLKPLILTVLKKELQKQETRNLVITFINNKLDLPKLNEEEEKRLFEQVYDAVAESLELILERI